MVDSTSRNFKNKEEKPKSFARKAGLILIALAIVFLATALIIKGLDGRSAKGARQAVFTTTGQIYFGYVRDKSAEMIEIDDVYYLSSYTSLAEAKDGNKISLIRMGTEIYKPDSAVFINRDHVIFMQDLEKDSQVNAAIVASEQKK